MSKFNSLLVFITTLVLAVACVFANEHELERRAEMGDALLQYGYNPPRINPDHCSGFRIDYPTAPGQAYEIGSIQQLKWTIDEGIKHTPNVITRIRILNSTQHNQFVVAENVSLYESENMFSPAFKTALLNQTSGSGSVTFPLSVEDVSGLYHYRIMVNYVGAPIHCVYESVPFMLLQSPYKKYTTGGAPKEILNPTYTLYSTSTLVADLYGNLVN